MKPTLYETVTSSIITALNRGVVPWRKPWHSQASVPINAISSKAYRGVNTLLLGMSQFSDPRWLTFNQVQDRRGRVKTGEKSTMIVFWKRWEPPTEESEAEAKRQIPMLRYFNVFNAEQCEDLGLPDLYRPAPLQDHQRIERADLLVRAMHDPPKILERGSSAWYRPSDDLVQVPPIQAFTSADAFYATLFHELGHATGHKRRLNRPAVTGEIRFGSGTYSKEELVAELTSSFCAATVSLDHSLTEDAGSYIQGWLSVLKADPKAVVIAAAQAQRAADLIRGVTYDS